MKEKLGSKELELVILKESPHVILLGCEQEKVIEHSLQYVTRKVNEGSVHGS